MAYVEAHASLKDHPKTKKVARLLDIPKVQVVGHMLCLWWWCQDYAQDGNLSKYSPEDIAEAAEWEGEPECFVEALLGCGNKDAPGFLTIEADGALVIHDWYLYGGKLFVQRKQGAIRQANWRARNAAVTASHDVTNGNITESNALLTHNVTPSNAYRGEEIIGDKKREDEDNRDTPAQTTPVNGTGDFPRRDRRLDPDYGEVCTKYEQNIGLLTPSIAQKLSDLMEQYPAFWVTSATDVATQAEKRNLLYIGGILKTWKREGKGPIPTNGAGHDAEPAQRPALPDSPPGGD